MPRLRSFWTIVNRVDNSRSQALLPVWRHLLLFQEVPSRVPLVIREKPPHLSAHCKPPEGVCIPVRRKGIRGGGWETHLSH